MLVGFTELSILYFIKASPGAWFLVIIMGNKVWFCNNYKNVLSKIEDGHGSCIAAMTTDSNHRVHMLLKPSLAKSGWVKHGAASREQISLWFRDERNCLCLFLDTACDKGKIYEILWHIQYKLTAGLFHWLSWVSLFPMLPPLLTAEDDVSLLQLPDRLSNKP